MRLPAPLSQAFRARSLACIGVASVLIFGVLAMHVIGPVGGCTATRVVAMPTMLSAHADSVHVQVHDRAHESSHSGAHGENQCTAVSVRSVLMPAAIPPPVFVGAAIAGLLFVGFRRRWHRPFAPDRLSIAGGLRR